MKNDKKRILSAAEKKHFRRLVLLLLLLLVLVLFFLPGRGIMSYLAIRRQVATLTEENQGLAEQNRALSEEIERLHHDDAYLESLARKKYGLLKDNETVYEFKRKKKKH